MYITTLIYSALFGSLVGTDAFGNRYYQRRGAAHGDSSVADARKRVKRWVIYKGKPEPSKVPPEWHGWLHYTFEQPLPAGKKYTWQKESRPNLTGTTGAYVPPGHLLAGGVRAAATADYEAWKP